LWVDVVARRVIQAPKLEPRIVRYELSDYEWVAIKPMLPNKPRGVPRVNDRRVLNGIFWVLRSGAPWRDLPENFGPYTTCYNRFVRWRRAGVWDQLTPSFNPAASPQRDGKKESQVRRHNRACRPSDKPSSTSSCGLHHYDARTVRCCSQAAFSQICQSSARVRTH
jgi:transposase